MVAMALVSIFFQSQNQSVPAIPLLVMDIRMIAVLIGSLACYGCKKYYLFNIIVM